MIVMSSKQETVLHTLLTLASKYNVDLIAALNYIQVSNDNSIENLINYIITYNRS